MSFIQFENATEKEKIREELRKPKVELLNRVGNAISECLVLIFTNLCYPLTQAKQNAAVRAEKQTMKTLSGETTWMLSDLVKKIDKKDETKKSKTSFYVLHFSLNGRSTHLLRIQMHNSPRSPDDTRTLTMISGTYLQTKYVTMYPIMLLLRRKNRGQPTKMLDNCDKCFASLKMQKALMVSM